MPLFGMGFVSFSTDGILTYGGSGAPANQKPATPTISAGTPTSSGATLTGSAFSDPDVGDTHAASQWQVTTAADTGYAAPVISTGDDAVNLTSYTASGLTAVTPYIARVRYKDSAGNYSAWSTSASFTTAAASGWTTVKQFNFRRTAAYVTDGANATYVIERPALDGFSEVYPTTRAIGGENVTFGWTSVDNAQPRDRLTSVDARLAGMHFNNSNSLAVFRIDLPAAGNYKIRLALGDAANANTEARIAVKDGATTLFSIANLTGTAAGHFLDATNTDYSSAAWPAGNTQVPVTVAGTVLTFEVGSAASAGNTYLAHIEVEKV